MPRKLFVIRYIPYIIIFLVTSTILVYINISISRGFTVEGSIYLGSDGVPKIVLNGTIEEGLEKIPLPAKPLPASVALYVNDELIAPIVVNESIVISGSPNSRFTVTYVPETIIEDGIISFTYYSDYDSYIYIDRNIILLNLPSNILDSNYIDNTLVIKFRGVFNIQYTVREGGETLPPQTGLINFMDILPIITVLIGGGGLIIFLILRMRRRTEAEEVIEELIDETDKAILDTLKERGGELYQSEIMRILGIPKTTLWRHLRRLEILGYIMIKKEYKRNRVILKRYYGS